MLTPVNLFIWPPPCRPLCRLLASAVPSRCQICAESCAHLPGLPRDLCQACYQALPWNRQACLRCGLPLPAGAAACGRCLRRPPPVAECRAVFVYASPLDRLLPRLKFHADLAAGRMLAELMAKTLRDACRPAALIPLPLHRERLRARGYDQALELAKPIARRLQLPLRDNVLQRARRTAPQSRLDAPSRRRNLRGAFTVRDDIALPAHIALIDDVMTTGATLHAAADALLHAGVRRVDAWVCARVA